MKMEKNAKRKEKKLTRAKRHDERRAKRDRARRSRPKARMQRQEAKELKNAARAARRNERKLKQAAPVKPEEEKSKKPVDPFYNKEVRIMMVKALTRASFKPVEKRKVIQSERRATSAGQSSGWKPGKNPAASELPQGRKPKKLTNSTVTQLLKAAMKLTSENREERSEEGSSEVEETKADEVGKLNSSDPSRQGGAGEEYLKQQDGVLLEDLGPDLTSESEQHKETKAHGDLKGGATESYGEDQTYAEMFLTAIGRAQLPLRLDEDTIGDGNCFPRAMVQQFQRPQVKLFLQSRGINIPDYMSLRRKVVHFARRNMHTRQFQTMRENYDFTQENLAEDETPRTWEEYWQAMLVDREWPDNFFIQACAWYLQMNIVIVYAGHATPEKPIHPIEGTFNSAKTGPTLLVGHITMQHYQSLLPLEEDRSLPTYLAPAAMNSTLEDVLNALGKAGAGSQVRKSGYCYFLFAF